MNQKERITSAKRGLATLVSLAMLSFGGSMLNKKGCAPKNVEVEYINPTPHDLITSSYGMRGKKSHPGTDIRAYCGDPISASADGVVVYTQDGNPSRRYTNSGFGNAVIVSHEDGLYTQYSHLENGSVTTTVGDFIKQGEQIGNSGNTGLVRMPCHLHLEVRNTESWKRDKWKKTHLDPEEVLPNIPHK